MTIRTIAFTVAALIGSLIAPGALATPAGPVTLLESAVVSGNVVRLGDLFSGTGENAEVPIAYAPAPGKRAVFDAKWLYRVAHAYGLDWRPLSLRDQAVIERASQIIGREEIEDRILAALLDKGVDEAMRVELSNRLFRIYVAADADATLAVEDITYDARTRRFTAVVATPPDDPAAQRFRVAGRAHRMSEVPVLARRMMTGDIIRENDVQWITMRNDRLDPDTVLDPEGLIGKSARRTMPAHRPLRASDVRRPVLVPRSGMVTIVFRMPQMTLTAKGRALEDGSEGDTIRITNTQSNMVIEGVVVGAGTVSVGPTATVALN